MSLPSLSIRRPVAMCCFIIALAVLGINSYMKIGIDLVPKSDTPYVQVKTIYPGATPEEVEVEVARRIEDAIASLDGLKHITSVCMESVCGMSLEFQLEIDADQALHSVREKINAVMDDFPSDVKTPVLEKFDLNAVPVVTLFVKGNCTMDELYDYVDDKLSDQFASITGVGGVRIHGGNEVQLHITPSREKLINAGLTVGDIISRIQANNRKMPAGNIKDGNREISLTYDAEFPDLESLRELEISKQPGKRIYLGDVAEVALKSKEIRQEAYLDGQAGIAIDVIKKGEANAVKTIHAIREKYDSIQKNNLMPGGMQLYWYHDNAEFIEASVHDAWTSVCLGILLTAGLLFLFLHEVRATLIVSITMPVSVIVSFALMHAMNYTVDLVTLLSIGSSVGVLVANSIVVIENIFKRKISGDDNKTAAAKGTEEVVNPVSASALTNIVVFLPMLAMISMVGTILKPFAGVMIIATFMSLFISFTLTPILASYLITDKTLRRSPLNIRMFRLWDANYDRLTKWFNRSMVWVERFPGTVICGVLVLCGIIAVITIPNLSLSFIPLIDRNEYSISLEYPSNSNLDEARNRTLAIVEKLHQHPEVKSTCTTVGYVNALPGQVSEGVYLAQISVLLKQKGMRLPIDEAMEGTRQELRKMDNLLFKLAVPEVTGNSGADVSLRIVGPDVDVLEKYNMIGLNELKASGIATDIDNNLRPGKPQIAFIPRRAILRNFGIDAIPLGATVVGSFEGVEVGDYKVGSRSYTIRVKMEESQGLDSIQKQNGGMYQGHPLNLDVLTSQKMDNVSVCLIRSDKESSAWLYANVVPGHANGELVDLMNKKVRDILPAGYELSYTGKTELMQDGAKDFKEVFSLAIILTYLVIAGIMESWRRPFLVLFTIPLGFLGMFLSIYLAGMSLSMLALLGGVMMIGVVVNNAILIMDECATLIQEGKSAHQAMLESMKNKFRPVVMTSIAAVVGMLPMAFGSGLGAELRASCGIALVGGLLFSSILTIYLIPALYFRFTKR